MSFFITDEIPSCSNCAYATKYIPYFSFPHSNPFCEKGNGECRVDKLCGDYKIITATCGRCKFIELKQNKKDFICVAHDKEVLFNSRTCDEFTPRKNRIRG